MMWFYEGGWGWLGLTAAMALWWGGIVALIVSAIRVVTGPPAGDQAIDILNRRVARVEITADAFERPVQSDPGVAGNLAQRLRLRLVRMCDGRRR